MGAGTRGFGGSPGVERPSPRGDAVLGKKWHPLLLRTLPTEGSLEFNDVKSSTDGVSDKVLSGSLDDLGESGLVVRDVVEDKLVRVHYPLTPAGRNLDPVIEELLEWNNEHLGEGR